MPNIKLVDAIPEDAVFIRNIQKNTWLDTYPNKQIGISVEDVEEKIQELSSEKGIEQIKKILKNSNNHAWLAKDGDKIVGFIGVSRSDSGNKVEALHVLPEYQRKGIGTELMNNGLEWLGKGVISFEVVSYNAKAITFYKTFGFIEKGVTENDPVVFKSGIRLPKIMMIRD